MFNDHLLMVSPALESCFKAGVRNLASEVGDLREPGVLPKAIGFQGWVGLSSSTIVHLFLVSSCLPGCHGPQQTHQVDNGLVGRKTRGIRSTDTGRQLASKSFTLDKWRN